MRRWLVTGAAVLLATLDAGAQAPAQSAARPLFENDRVAIWRVGPGAPVPGAAGALRLAGVLVSLADGRVRLVDTAATPAAPLGAAVMIQLKGSRTAPMAPPRDTAPAFPRQGATLVLESERVAVWDVAWTTGMKTPLHFHDRDVAVVYLGAGTVRSIPLDGPPTATPRAFGEAVFIPRGRTHVEECVDGPRRDIVVELK